jgi:hypothetical protein
VSGAMSVTVWDSEGRLSDTTWDSNGGTECPHFTKIIAHNEDVLNSRHK